MGIQAPHFVTLLVGLLLVLFPINPIPAYAHVIVGTPRDDNIVVTEGEDVEGVESGGGDDTIVVEENADVNREVQESGSEVVVAGATAIDAGRGDDTVQNSGTVAGVAGAVATAGSVLLTIDEPTTGHPGGRPLSDTSATADATATGIVGGKHIDNIHNSGTVLADVTSSAITLGGNAAIEVTEDGSFSGVALSDASTTANATGMGIDGGDDDDTIVNGGVINVISDSSATGMATQLIVAGEVTLNSDTAGDVANSVLSDARTNANARMTGIDGDDGNDTIINSGNITADADSAATGVSAGLIISGVVGVNSATTGDVSSSIVSDASANANAAATGIDGGDGGDSIMNAGDVTSTADSTATGVSAALGITGVAGINSDTTGGASSSTVSDTGANASATATGIDGGDGNDTIRNSGNIIANAGSTSTGVSAGLTILGSVDIAFGDAEGNDTPVVEEEDDTEAEGDVSSSTLSDASSLADATAAGIDGGDGDDSIVNAGDIVSTASSTATGVTATMGITGVVGINTNTDGEVMGFTVSDSSATAKTHSVGIDGGAGDDTISNFETIVAIADSDATAVSASLNIVGEVAVNGEAESDISGSAASDASANADAVAMGINGDEGNDIVGNMGTIVAVADSDAIGVAASLDISGKVVIKSEKYGDTPTIGAGADDKPVAEGDVSNKAVSNAGANANAAATGIDGGSGDDLIDNTDVVVASADSTATGVSAALNIGAVVAIKSGADVDLSGKSASDMSATSSATATGIDGASGDDSINNHGMITVMNNGSDHADASATGVSAALNVEAVVAFEGEAKANVAGAVLSDGSTNSTAEGTGIAGGEGSDTIVNTGDIIANPGAEATGVTAALGIAASVSFKADADVEVSGETLSDTSVTAVALATGIEGDEGVDTIINRGAITLMKSGDPADEDIDASAIGVAATLGITAHIQIEGDAEVDISGSTMTDARTTANAEATGIDGGDGNDLIFNTGDIFANPEADATGVGVTVDISGTLVYKGTATGDVSSNAVSDTSVNATATAAGIDAGDGDDTITNHGNIGLFSDASATNVAVDVGISGAVTIKSAALIDEESQVLNDASAAAVASANGLDGGEGNDAIDNAGTIKVNSHAEADPTSVTVNITGNMGLADGSSASDSSGTAIARSIGIDGGMAIDSIDNAGDITAISTATVDATSVTASITGNMGLTEGSSVSDSSGTAIARSVGIGGGEGNDTIENAGAIGALSYADADATSVDVDVSVTLGLSDRSSLSDSSGTAIARSIGIDGGMGIDTIDNEGDITAISTAAADAASTDVSVTSGLAGESFVEADSSATATAQSIGIFGGGDDDTITNMGDSTISSSSSSTTEADNVIVALAFGIGSGNQTESNASTVSRAYASGIYGGEGVDLITNDGEIFATAISNTDVNSTTVNISFLGAATSTADTSVTSETVAIGIDGGADGDTIINHSLIDVDSFSTVTMDSFGFNLYGTGDAGGTLGAMILATGIAGGDGLDEILNEDAITVDANSILLAQGDSNIVFGTADVSSKSGAAAEAVGIDGGADDDLLVNRLLIDVDSNATVLLNNDSFTLGGTGETGGTLEAGTISKGISGGSGSDDIWNVGAIIVDASSSLLADGGAITIFGTADVDSASTAVADAVGIDGGADDDLIVNQAESLIDVAAGSRFTLNNDSFTFGGTGDTGGALEAMIRATGMGGGDGVDEIRNRGNTVVGAESSLLADGGSITIFGTADVVSTAGAAAEAAGIDGGADDDLIVNEDESLIDVTAGSTVTLNNDSFAFGGTSDAGGTLEARTTSKGIFGGSGSDDIWNDGTIMVDAGSSLSADGGGVTIFGTADVGSTSTAAAEVAGIDGGADDDLIVNRDDSLIDVTADSTVTLNNDSFTFGGTGETGGTLEGTTRAIGIAGGDGLDEIWNKGTIEVRSQSSIGTVSGSDVVFGTSEVGAEATAKTTVVGITGGYGNDLIVNKGDIILNPAADVYFSGSSWEAIGTADANATFSARSQSIGIDGGSGDDTILNEGGMSIFNTSSATTDGESYAGLGTSNGSGITLARSSATGIFGGDGDDIIANTRQMTVDTISSSKSTGSAETFLGNPRAAASAQSDAEAVGINSGNGYDTIQNANTIDVDSRAEAEGRADTYSDLGDRASYAYASTSATADGIHASEEAEMIINSGMIDVKAVASSIARATSTGGPFEAYAKAQTHAESIAHGIRAGSGSDAEDFNTYVLIDDGEVRVEARAEATSGTWAEEDSGGEVAISEIDVTAKAYGVMTGGGNDIVENNGLIEVKANVIAKAGAYTEDDDETWRDSVDIEMMAWGIDAGDGNNVIDNYGAIEVLMIAIAEDTSSFFGVLTEADIKMMARGINAGNGNDVITNHGDIRVDFDADTGFSIVSDADTKAVGIKAGDGDNIIANYAGIYMLAEADDGLGSIFGSTARADAAGIETGEGIDIITNDDDGIIEVRADADASSPMGLSAANASVAGIESGAGNDVVMNLGTVAVQAHADAVGFVSIAGADAVGIHMGEGDDTLTNFGDILTEVVVNGVSNTGIAIDLDAGDDLLVLGHGSVAAGDVDLGEGDDTLHLFGTPTVNGAITTGSGINSLILEGPGIFGVHLPDFYAATKLGSGTFTIADLGAGIARFEVDGGTFEIDHGYQLAADGEYYTFIQADGMFGQLRINGDAELGGIIDVSEKGYGAYLDGMTFDVLTAGDMSGLFDSSTLPDSTLLLDFDLNYLYDPGVVQVGVSAASFTTVATNYIERTVAEYLDRILGSAKGDLGYLLGEIQHFASADKFSAALLSLSSDSYDSGTRTTFEVTRLYIQAIQQRLRTLRSPFPSLSPGMQAKRSIPLLAYNGPDASIGRLVEGERVRSEKRYGAWMQGFGQWGDEDGDDGYTGFGYNVGGVAIGFDHAFANNLIAGAGLEYAHADIDLDRDAGGGEIESIGFSIYGTYFVDHLYIDGVLSYAGQDYDNERIVVIGSERRVARSDHDGDAFSVFVEGGYEFPVDRWIIGPFASLDYIYLDEDGFRETGAGGVDLLVDDRQTDSLVSELGLRAGTIFDVKSFSLIPEAGIAWSHDFDIDDRNIRSSFAGTPGSSFTIAGRDTDHDGVTVDVGLTMLHPSGWSAALKYNGDFRDDREAHGIIGGVGYAF